MHGIQASVNLLQSRMETYVDGVLAKYTQYSDLADLIENALSNLYYHDLVSLTEEQLEPFYRERKHKRRLKTKPRPYLIAQSKCRITR